jgi:hypothetical protein
MPKGEKSNERSISTGEREGTVLADGIVASRVRTVGEGVSATTLSVITVGVIGTVATAETTSVATTEVSVPVIVGDVPNRSGTIGVNNGGAVGVTAFRSVMIRLGVMALVGGLREVGVGRGVMVASNGSMSFNSSSQAMPFLSSSRR